MVMYYFSELSLVFLKLHHGLNYERNVRLVCVDFLVLSKDPLCFFLGTCFKNECPALYPHDFVSRQLSPFINALNSVEHFPQSQKYTVAPPTSPLYARISEVYLPS